MGRMAQAEERRHRQVAEEQEAVAAADRERRALAHQPQAAVAVEAVASAPRQDLESGLDSYSPPVE